MSDKTFTLKALIMQRIKQAPVSAVWTPVDFLDLGNRDAVDKTLQRLIASNDLRRIARGLYDQPRLNVLTKQPASPDYSSVIEAVGRRDQVRILIDGMTAANDLGLTHTVPGQIIVHTDGRMRPIQLGNLTIQFKKTSPSKLYWAGHPAMRIVQALYWLHSSIQDGAQVTQDRVKTKLSRLLRESTQANQIRHDLQSGLHTVPSWMQQWIRELLAPAIPGEAI